MDLNTFDRIFPFGFVVDNNLHLKFICRSLVKLFPKMNLGENINLYLEVGAIDKSDLSFDYFKENLDQLLILKGKDQDVILRGQLIEVSDEFFVLVSPWLTSTVDIDKLGLKFSDFAIHDPINDFVMLMQ